MIVFSGNLKTDLFRNMLCWSQPIFQNMKWIIKLISMKKMFILLRSIIIFARRKKTSVKRKKNTIKSRIRSSDCLSLSIISTFKKQLLSTFCFTLRSSEEKKDLRLTLRTLCSDAKCDSYSEVGEESLISGSRWESTKRLLNMSSRKERSYSSTGTRMLRH